jgi:hypothetical protein
VVGDQRRQLVVALGLSSISRSRRRGVGGGSPLRQLGAVGDLAVSGWRKAKTCSGYISAS